MKKPNLYVSRSFVEFGPFTEEELVDFQARGVLRDIDHVRYHGKDDWIEVSGWMSSVNTTTPTPKMAVQKKAAPANKAVAKKAAPAKKAAVKKAAPKKK